MNNTELMRLRPVNLGLGKQVKYSYMWMMTAYTISFASNAERKKVGCVVVTPSMGLYTGYNGTAPGDDNRCEIEDRTKEEVFHAEENAFDKMLKEGVSAQGSVVYLTLTPCIHCAKRIAGAGVECVFYLEEYRCSKGIDYLRKRGVKCMSWKELLGIPFQPLNFEGLEDG